MSKYDIGVGEDFPLDESQKQDGRDERCGRHHHHHRHGHHRHAHLAAVTLLFALAAHQGARRTRHGEEH